MPISVDGLEHMCERVLVQRTDTMQKLIKHLSQVDPLRVSKFRVVACIVSPDGKITPPVWSSEKRDNLERVLNEVEKEVPHWHDTSNTLYALSIQDLAPPEPVDEEIAGVIDHYSLRFSRREVLELVA